MKTNSSLNVKKLIEYMYPKRDISLLVYTLLVLIFINYSFAAFAQKRNLYAENYDNVSVINTFSAVNQQGNVCLTWTVKHPDKTVPFLIERSSDGHHYEIVGLRNGVSSKLDQVISFSFIDENPLPGISYYRIRYYKKNNREYKSKPVAVSEGKQVKWNATGNQDMDKMWLYQN